MNDQGRQPIQPTRARFATTRWSMVLRAGDQADSHCSEALQELCQSYWYPLYAYVRHQGLSTQDAEDATQAFFTRLLEKEQLARLSRQGGKFRSFLLKAMQHFLNDQWRRDQALKRGGGHALLSWDADEAEDRYQHEPIETTTPEALFEQNWAVTLLETVFKNLQQEQQDQGKGEQFQQLRFCLTGQRREVPYVELAERLTMSEASLKVTVHRLRQRYRDLLRQEVAHTVSTPDEEEEELQYLFQILA